MSANDALAAAVGTAAVSASAAASALSAQSSPDADVGDSVREGWALTPDVILFGAAAVMTVAVVAFGIWLFVRAARESDATPPERGGA